MRCILEIWGENIPLASGEVRGILEGEGMDFEFLAVDYPVVMVETESCDPLRRAGLLRRISRYIYSGSEIPNLKMHFDNYAIRVRRREKNSELKDVEKTLARGIEGKVNLSNPKNVLRVYIGDNIYIGLELFTLENFETRRAKNLPVSYPITMHPRLARAMVNLARVKKGARILDPFCGTGTILIEAGLAGMKPYGSDIDERMLRASEINLKKFGIEAYLQLIDVGDIEGEYDAIVTDPPYGRSSSTGGERIYALYKRAFKRFSELVDRVVISLPDERAIRIGEKYFTLREVYPYKVHKSLTRYFSYFHI